MTDARDTATGERDTPMTGTYVKVIVVEIAIVVLLWMLGRLYQ